MPSPQIASIHVSSAKSVFMNFSSNWRGSVKVALGGEGAFGHLWNPLEAVRLAFGTSFLTWKRLTRDRIFWPVEEQTSSSKVFSFNKYKRQNFHSWAKVDRGKKELLKSNITWLIEEILWSHEEELGRALAMCDTVSETIIVPRWQKFWMDITIEMWNCRFVLTRKDLEEVSHFIQFAVWRWFLCSSRNIKEI